MKTDIKVNVTVKDIFNAQAGKGFKEAGTSKLKGNLTGFAVYTKEEPDKNTGEVKEKEISLMVVDGNIYSGESIVVADRLKQISMFLTEDEITNGVDIEFTELKVGRGMATSFILC